MRAFDIDGAFWPDSLDEGRMPNGRGSEYSIRYVRPSADTSHSRVAAAMHASVRMAKLLVEGGPHALRPAL